MPFTRADARRFYDAFGSKQDSQSFYEKPALDWLAKNGRFEEADAVFELGCGTGAFAKQLLEKRLPPSARYKAADLSPVMVDLAGKKLAAWRDRVSVELTGGSFAFDDPTGVFDRFVAAYVLDLLDEKDIRAALQEADRLLADGGLLCIASLTNGAGPITGFISWLWSRVHQIAPFVVGGCRPVRLTPYLDSRIWRIVHANVMCSWGVCSEVVIAEAKEQELAWSELA